MPGMLDCSGNILHATEQKTSPSAKTKGAQDSEIYMQTTSPLLQMLMPPSLSVVQESQHQLPRLQRTWKRTTCNAFISTLVTAQQQKAD